MTTDEASGRGLAAVQDAPPGGIVSFYRQHGFQMWYVEMYR